MFSEYSILEKWLTKKNCSIASGNSKIKPRVSMSLPELSKWGLSFISFKWLNFYELKTTTYWNFGFSCFLIKESMSAVTFVFLNLILLRLSKFNFISYFIPLFPIGSEANTIIWIFLNTGSFIFSLTKFPISHPEN